MGLSVDIQGKSGASCSPRQSHRTDTGSHSPSSPKSKALTPHKHTTQAPTYRYLILLLALALVQWRGLVRLADALEHVQHALRCIREAVRRAHGLERGVARGVARRARDPPSGEGAGAVVGAVVAHPLICELEIRVVALRNLEDGLMIGWGKKFVRPRGDLRVMLGLHLIFEIIVPICSSRLERSSARVMHQSIRSQRLWKKGLTTLKAETSHSRD